MKVLHVIPSVGPLRGGPSVMMRTMARGLVQDGLAVDVATTDDNGHGRLIVSYSKPVVEEGVTYRYFRRQTRFYNFSWPLTCWLAQHVRDYDLVHIHALFSYAAIPATYWANQWKVPYIVRPLGVLNHWGMQNRRPWLKKLSYYLIEKHILRSAAAIHYTSEQERLEAAELGIRQKSVVIPNTADIPFSAINFTPGQFRARNPHLANRSLILFLSRLDPKKGLDILFLAFAQARAQHPRAMLVLAGSGEPAFTAHLQREAARLGIASDIFWTGFLTGEEKWAAMADADIFVLPSYSENFGVAVVEAMVFGMPVVVSDQVAIHWEISQAQAGLVIPCRAKDLTEALTTLLKNVGLRSQMGANGRRLAQTKFSPEAGKGRLIKFYSEICRPTLRGADHTVI